MLTRGEEEIRGKDLLHVLIEEFVAAVAGEEARVVVPGEAGLRNLTYQVELLRGADRG